MPTPKNAFRSTVIRARIDADVKERASHVLESMGLTLSDVLREVMVRLADDKKLPFRVRTSLGSVRAVSVGMINEDGFWTRKRALQAADHAKATDGLLAHEETLFLRSESLQGAVPLWPKDAFSDCEVNF
jgi:addiction module RelB/DinJ family antitoxin